ncbi:DUF3466 family protein [Idiomarina xiamenensis]|uniref:DUF3466 family protein n=1 Tax=Idiomarina xiamenensis 10-D-4 TaxID=740709 RepID=K2KK22_9GAMM|nr:DUF3466 family protein [Idiomarina xiamenensis]EKE87022.1 hypothetical protein A10D4_02232 [Idiomarina xiamenensis 10-D-4]
MMKQFAYGAVSAAVLSAVTMGQARADAYSVSEVATPDNYLQQFAVSLNDAGEAVGIARTPLGLDIDLTKVSVSTLNSLGITSTQANEGYELSETQYLNLVRLLEDSTNQNAGQLRIGNNAATTMMGNTATLVPFFDSNDNSLPISTENLFYGINNGGYAFGRGSAPYEPLEYTYTNSDDEEVSITYYVRDFISRAVWYDGANLTRIDPPETTELGGESSIMDMNDNSLAVGYASVGLSPSAETVIDNCNNPDEDQSTLSRPPEICIWNAWFSLQSARAEQFRPNYFSASRIASNRSIYDMRGYAWQLDSQGQVISSKQLGLLTERNDEDDSGDFSSYAYAVNNNDVIVGQSWTYYDGNESTGGRIKMPAIFVDDQVLPVTENTDYFWGSATDINDNNIVIGYLIKRINGSFRNVGFTYDVDAETPAVQEMNAFFTGASTTPMAINNNGVIVGSAEIEASISDTRRRVGFVYDTTAEQPKMLDLNDAISCDANYYIVEANSINDQGDILATAVQTQTYTDSDGNERSRQVAKTIRLNATGGEFNDCTEEANKVEREGAATTPWQLLGLALMGALITIRRKFSH